MFVFKFDTCILLILLGLGRPCWVLKSQLTWNSQCTPGWPQNHIHLPVTNWHMCIFFLILCALVFCLNAYVSAGPPGTGAIDSCELPCRCWEWNWGSQEEQSVLFNLCAIIPMRFFFWGGFFFALLRQFNSPGCLGTHSVGQASLELSNLPTAASWVPGLKTCATTDQYVHVNY